MIMLRSRAAVRVQFEKALSVLYVTVRKKYFWEFAFPAFKAKTFRNCLEIVRNNELKNRIKDMFLFFILNTSN